MMTYSHLRHHGGQQPPSHHGGQQPPLPPWRPTANPFIMVPTAAPSIMVAYTRTSHHGVQQPPLQSGRPTATLPINVGNSYPSHQSHQQLPFPLWWLAAALPNMVPHNCPCHCGTLHIIMVIIVATMMIYILPSWWPTAIPPIIVANSTPSYHGGLQPLLPSWWLTSTPLLSSW